MAPSCEKWIWKFGLGDRAEPFVVQEAAELRDERGSPSWIRIEPCASRHRQNSGAFWRKSAPCLSLTKTIIRGSAVGGDIARGLLRREDVGVAIKRQSTGACAAGVPKSHQRVSSASCRLCR